MKLRLTLVAAAVVAISTAAACSDDKAMPTPTPGPLSPTAPFIAGLAPPGGGIGTTVLVAGSRFGATQSSSTISFAGFSAPVIAWDDSRLSVTVPAGVHAGPVDVRLLVHTTASNAAGFIVAS